jgi:uncharacterized membrane protein
MAQTARKRGTGAASTPRSSRTQRRRGASDGDAKRKTAAAGAKRVVKAASSKPTVDAKRAAKAASPKRVARKLARKAIARAVRTAARGAGRIVSSGARAAVSGMRSANLESLLARARTLPIQRSLDVAVPLEVAWDQWESLRFIPEGTHRVASIERDGDDRLVGRVHGLRVERDWEAEIVDERVDESFAWHSVGGSDCSGLVTFHRLSDRLTRVELHLDVIPGGVAEALELVSRVADRRAGAELRRFKAYAETLDPDEYPPLDDEGETDDDDDDVDEDVDEDDDITEED